MQIPVTFSASAVLTEEGCIVTLTGSGGYGTHDDGAGRVATSSITLTEGAAVDAVKAAMQFAIDERVAELDRLATAAAYESLVVSMRHG